MWPTTLLNLIIGRWEVRGESKKYVEFHFVSAFRKRTTWFFVWYINCCQCLTPAIGTGEKEDSSPRTFTFFPCSAFYIGFRFHKSSLNSGQTLQDVWCITKLCRSVLFANLFASTYAFPISQWAYQFHLETVWIPCDT